MLPIGFLSAIALSANSFAAIPVNLAHQQFTSPAASITASALLNQAGLKEINRSSDQNRTLHVRVQQTYLGYSVWGADAVIHIPQGDKAGKNISDVIATVQANKGSMNGTIYQNIQHDLPSAPTDASQAAVNAAIGLFQGNTGVKTAPQQIQSQLIVYLDKNNKAHWAYHISFYVQEDASHELPSKPNYILDAMTFVPYAQWDNLQTVDNVKAGGFGGNPKSGKYIYDGSSGNLPAFPIQRNSVISSCYMQNDDVTVYSKRWFIKMGENFSCLNTDAQHGNIYWDADQDASNGGYSPANDAMFDGLVIKHMYQDWYGIPVLKQDNKPMMLTMVVHAHMQNAYWDGQEMVFGDGGSVLYPLTSIGVGAHEISHGFTEQHSKLEYQNQSGGLNESFSDMAAQAGEFYAFGHNSWVIGSEIFKGDGAIRYMDQPSKDCQAGKAPGQGCSIDNMDEYVALSTYADTLPENERQSFIVHTASGVFNHAFYLLANSAGWNVRKAFDVMVQANSHYWTSTTDFDGAACGVLSAAKDLNYDQVAIKSVFKAVDVDISQC